MRIWKFLLPLLVSTLAFAAQPDRILSTIDSSQSVALARSLHPKAQPQFDQGAVEPSLKLSYMTLLMAPSPSQQKALDLLLAQQQDRNSANYHKWLTPQQFADRFGLSQNDLNKVTAWLKSQGFHILSTGGGRNSVVFSGTAAQVRSAFGAEIHRYNVNGKQHIANSTPLMVPAALGGIVRTVMGVNNFGPHPASQFRGVGAASSARRNYFDATYDTNFLAPGDIATIYGLSSFYADATPIDGTGQKLAIIGQTDVYLADINDFRSGFALNPITGCTTNTNGVITVCNSTYFQYVAVGTDPGTTYGCGDLGEADLDIEWSGAVARKAQIVFVNAPVVYDSQCNPLGTAGGVNAALTAAINPPSGPPLAPVMSLSYGICELEAEDLETVLQQGNVEGVTIMNSSGDVGSATCDFNPPNNSQPFQPAVNGLAVSYPASSPEVTAVGGTEISIADDANPPNSFWGTTNGTTGGSALMYIPEIPWNDDEELALFCQGDPSNEFCVQGGVPATPGWVPLTASATAAQVQEDIWLSIGGGGASNCFYESSGGICFGAGPGPSGGGLAQPQYQQSLVVPGAPAGVRYVPDVSLLASPNFPSYIFCTPENAPSNTASTCANGIATAATNLSLVGGTSASSPIFAGIVTLLNQYLNGASSAGLGNINPTLYALAANPANFAFHPITSGDNFVYCDAGEPSTQPIGIRCPASGTAVIGYSAANADPTTGYNLVNGLGSVDASTLFPAWLATIPNFSLSASSGSVSASAGQNSNATTITVAPANGFSSSVTFSCSGLPSGATCNFSPASSPTSTVLTVDTSANMAAATTSFTVTGTSGSLSSTASVSITVSATTETFTLATSPASASLSIAPGATSGNTVNLTITDPGNTGFIVNNSGTLVTTLPLSYTCTIAPTPAGASCSVSPNPSTSTALTASVATTAPTVQLRPPFGRGSGIFYAMLLPGLFGIVFAAGSGKRGTRLLSLIVVLGISTLWLGACGGSGSGGGGTSNPGTPAGSYVVNISATTGGASPITKTTSFMLTVQ